MTSNKADAERALLAFVRGQVTWRDLARFGLVRSVRDREVAFTVPADFPGVRPNITDVAAGLVSQRGTRRQEWASALLALDVDLADLENDRRGAGIVEAIWDAAAGHVSEAALTDARAILSGRTPQADINLRVRRNRGRRLWPEFRRALAVALDEEVSDDRLLPLDDTERLRESFFETLKRGTHVIHLIRGNTGLDDLLAVAQRIATRDPDLDVVLLHQHDTVTGAVRVRVAPALRNALRVWSVVGHDLFLTTHGAADGLCLEYNHDPAGDSYELHLWGRFARDLDA